MTEDRIRMFRKSRDKAINFVKLNRDIIYPVQPLTKRTDSPIRVSQASILQTPAEVSLKFNDGLASERVQRPSKLDFNSINEQLRLRLNQPLSIAKSRGSHPLTKRESPDAFEGKLTTVVVQGEHVSAKSYV